MQELRQIDVRAIDLEALGVQIAYVMTDSPARKDACLRNARLIAASEDVLEALTSLRDAVDRYFGPSKAGAAWPKYFDPEMHAAWAAIRKATGEQL
jgi:hypothetical protein